MKAFKNFLTVNDLILERWSQLRSANFGALAPPKIQILKLYKFYYLPNPRHRIIHAPVIQQNKIITRTVLTTLSDEQNIDALQFYDPRAQEFSDDGKVVSTNYGYRIRHLNNTDQILQVIDQFKRDPNTRRAVIHIHTVSDCERKYTPCIDSIHFLIRNNKLECQTFWRSENALTLFPVNLFEFTMFQELICSELSLSPGPYIHTVSSLHYYLDDQERFDATLKFLNTCEKPTSMNTMSENSLKQISILREYEKKIRLNAMSDGEPKEFELLSDYWKFFAEKIRFEAISKLKKLKLNALSV